MNIKLCIDPGHGMGNARPSQYDTGAQAAGVDEADIALKWALTLKQVCVDNHIPVWLTRGDAVTPDPVGSRDDRAEAQGCTHMVSIHLNEGGGTGVETFYRNEADKGFGLIVHGATLIATALHDRGMKREGESQHSRLAVFDFDGPNCLVEIGFIDNAADRAKLMNVQTRLRWAGLIVSDLAAIKIAGKP